MSQRETRGEGTGGETTADTAFLAARWDAEYRNQRYVAEPPLPFVDRILHTLRADAAAARGVGLYVGCGNGRNFVPLVDASLDLFGLDVSGEAIEQLARRCPTLPRHRLLHGELRTFRTPISHFDYIIAIQVLQHGGESDVAAYFGAIATLLRPGGLVFVRVNSASTQVYHAHTIVERNELGGFTVRYDDGPKTGLLIHFYSRAELIRHLDRAFTVVDPPREDVIAREPAKSGSWAQWETIWRRASGQSGGDREAVS